MSIDKRTIEQWIAEAREAELIGEQGFDTDVAADGRADALLYPSSLKQKNGVVLALLKVPGASHDEPTFAWDRALGIFGSPEGLKGFEGQSVDITTGTGGVHGKALIGSLSHANAVALRQALPFTAPSPL